MSNIKNADTIIKSFEVCSKNIEHLKNGISYVESYFSDKNFPGWVWTINVRGNYQNKPYLEINGASSETSLNCTSYARIYLKCHCCNKTGISLIIERVIPKLNAWVLEWKEREFYRTTLDPLLENTIAGMKCKDDEFLPQLAKILTDIKKENDINSGVTQIKSLLKQIQLKKDF